MFFPAISELEPIARAAGDAIMAIYSQPFAVEYKQDESPLTAADKGAHEVIVQALARLTPDIPVLSEESGPEVMAARHGWSCYWLVDPLDGTKEFVSRNGEFTVNIALIEEGTPRWGLVYAPVLDQLWYGGKGLGPGGWLMASVRPSRADLIRKVHPGGWWAAAITSPRPPWITWRALVTWRGARLS